MAAASAAAGRDEHGVLARRFFAKKQVTEGMGPAEQRCHILEGRTLSYNEDRGSKLRKGTLWPLGLSCVGARRGDSKPGDFCPFHHVNPWPFFGYLVMPLTRCVSLAELPDPLCPSLLARVGLSSGRRCVCRRRFNRLSGLHSSLSLGLLLRC